MIERRKRTLCKTIVWRIVASSATAIIAFIVTGEFSIALGIGVIDIFIKLIIYYLHERIWDKIKWGKVFR